MVSAWREQCDSSVLRDRTKTLLTTLCGRKTSATRCTATPSDLSPRAQVTTSSYLDPALFVLASQYGHWHLPKCILDYPDVVDAIRGEAQQVLKDLSAAFNPAKSGN
ncbi:uncharacterized protein PHALS_10410 [Plasmopara halstedii]|uniref:Uncharacterized protein n=1 Tax=Plasmopara halstedii TaxID=4781 RepID=A0A0P1AGA4_PLAHL|nr:uncharacterized protein PHALS_10410 [Plasmopara halstedii]CEG40198.1 hypothetical protein PHALS_10410 [Plasmopara halstedii]|eukprot:XP_024576567.1 hypothetical protein PHALS_10410 [Plasmopara halstedii]